jgi:anaerobic magnesium-protoporphyrin IX monomethyl ester cyclase
MRVVLADLEGAGGLVAKDTVVGGYGHRLVPFSKVSRVYGCLKRRYFNVPSIQMAYLAAILDRAGHEVVFTRRHQVDGDLAIVLSSLVDYRNETRWADQTRARGVPVGFVGLAASKLPQLFTDHADFVIRGEPEEAVSRLAAGETLCGLCHSDPVDDLDSLPFPRWDLLLPRRQGGVGMSGRPASHRFQLLGSRGCPEFCTYCPHRILAGYRARSVNNIVDELSTLCESTRRPYVIFRDPMFTENRDRVLALCDEIGARGLDLRFECETRLDRLDANLLDRMHAAGLHAIGFGVETVLPEALRNVGRRPGPVEHQRHLIAHCRKRGIATATYYVIGFPADNWESVGATIDFAIELGSTIAQFKLLTPFPATPLFTQMESHIYETDWQKFDGYTPTFHHRNLTAQELVFLLSAAYTRFYMRPSWVANLLRIQNQHLRSWASRLDDKTAAALSRREIARMSRPVIC